MSKLKVSALGKEETAPTRSESNVDHVDKASNKYDDDEENNNNNSNNSNNNKYSRSNSFGSVIDVQSQPGFCASAAELNAASSKHPSSYRPYTSNSNSNMLQNRSRVSASPAASTAAYQPEYSHVFSTTASKNVINQTSSHYRSQHSYLNGSSNNNFESSQAAVKSQNLNSSIHGNNFSSSNINYSLDSQSYPRHLHALSHQGYASSYGNATNINATNSGIYNINQLIAQYSQ